VIGLDTNVVIRYLTQDDAKQSAVATRLIEKTLSVEQRGFIAAVVLCEVAWVLEVRYEAGRDRIREVIEGLLTSKQILVEGAELVWKALRAMEGSSADFSDAFIAQVALARGAEKTLTFDKSAAKLPGFELLA
jgi:predicted nucleic-acid-binding protein